ncbi:MAG: hypothetical protein ACI9U2_004558, partial [Bradymonadia bacterium]
HHSQQSRPPRGPVEGWRGALPDSFARMYLPNI